MRLGISASVEGSCHRGTIYARRFGPLPLDALIFRRQQQRPSTDEYVARVVGWKSDRPGSELYTPTGRRPARHATCRNTRPVRRVAALNVGHRVMNPSVRHADQLDPGSPCRAGR